MLPVVGVVFVVDARVAALLAEVAPNRLVRRLGTMAVAGSIEVVREVVIPRPLGGSGQVAGMVGIDAESSISYERGLDALLRRDAKHCLKVLSTMSDDLRRNDGAMQVIEQQAIRILSAEESGAETFFEGPLFDLPANE